MGTVTLQSAKRLLDLNLYEGGAFQFFFLHSFGFTSVEDTYFRWRHGAHDKGTRFRLRMILNSGEWVPALDEVVDGGVGVILSGVEGSFPLLFRVVQAGRWCGLEGAAWECES